MPKLQIFNNFPSLSVQTVKEKCHMTSLIVESNKEKIQASLPAKQRLTDIDMVAGGKA